MTSFSSTQIIPGFAFARTRDKAFAAVRRLWRVRQAQGMTQADIASKLGADRGWVSRKLSGPSNWTLRTLAELAEAMDGEIEISITDLREGPGPENADCYSEYDDVDLQGGGASIQKPTPLPQSNFLGAA